MNPREIGRMPRAALCSLFLMTSLGVAGAAMAATVNPPPSDAYLPNPGIGFQAMHDLDAPVLPETVAYRRPQYGWSLQNPAPGVYDWSAIDADLAAAVSLGKQFSFRVYTMRGENFGGHRVPAWVVSEGVPILGSGQPRWSNCVYQQRWGEFVDAMRQHFDGNPGIAFLDISGYGNFNEWSWNSQTEWDDDALHPTTLDGMARKRLADMFLGGSGTIDCTVAGGGTQSVSYSYTGFQHTQLVMPFAGTQQSTRYAHWRRSDVGFREDCLGSTWHTDGMLESVGDVIAATWRNAPVVYELCGAEDLAAARAVLEVTHGSVVHENNGGNDLAQLEDTLREAGYRFTLREATFPDISGFTGSLEVSLAWRNVGLAPAYAKAGQDFEARAYLLGPGEAVAAQWTLASDPNDWMPADPAGSLPPDQASTSELPLPPGLHLAAYTLAVGIFDQRTGHHVALANMGSDSENRLPLGFIQFTTGEACGDGLARPDLGEQCDDGNLVPGDCCSGSCTAETGSCDDGNPCTTGDACSAGTCTGGPPLPCDDGVACTVDTCDPASGCVATTDDSACDDGIACTADTCSAVAGCSHAPDDSLCDDSDLCTADTCNPSTLACEHGAAPQPDCAAAGSASFALSDTNGKEKLAWSWKNGTVATTTLGDPSTDTGYALCVYSGNALAFRANVPAGMTCGGASDCWDQRSDRLSYAKADAAPEGISSISVRAGRPGRDRVQWKGKYSFLAVPDPAVPGFLFDPALAVTVQSVNSAGACQGATFSAADVKKNLADSFRAAAK